MPTALEKLIKILNQEKRNGYKNETVTGGLNAYSPNWAAEARQQARRPEQHTLIEEIVLVLADYQNSQRAHERAELATYMVDRLTQRVEVAEKYRVLLPKSPSTPQGSETNLPSAKNTRPTREAAPNRLSEGRGRRDSSTSEQANQPLPKPRRKARPKTSGEDMVKIWGELRQPLTVVRGIGEKMAEKLQKIGPTTVGELLFLLPRRYDDYSKMLPLNKLQPDQTYTVIGTITHLTVRPGKRNMEILVLKMSDGTGVMEVSFFNQIWLKRQLKVGMQLVLSGKTSLFLGKVVMTNPAWEPVEQQTLHTGGIVPIYPLTKGLSAHTMRKLMHGLVEDWAGRLPDPVPVSVLDRTNQVELNWALQQVHFPDRLEYVDYARERLAFDELLALQLGVMANRTEWQSQPAPSLAAEDDWLKDFYGALPFSLTGAQQRSIESVRNDMRQNIPMNRLLQGDVGSGKTMVALATLAIAAINGQQGVLMAPTSILAEQHYQKMSALVPQLPLLADKKVALLTGSLTERARRDVYEGLANGSIDIAIGTHAVIQEGVEFANLAAVVIDEQHRFGVEQRGILRGKGTNPHLLVMTATPIPRTLSLTMYADLDISILDEMPPGRTPIQTRLVDTGLRTRVYEFVDHQVLQKGRQAYVIYPLIEASEVLEAESAVEGYEFIQREIYPMYQVGLLHGRMKAAEKEAVMNAFARGETQVLVSTTVIEVGVDVPNAAAIIIENAERFGLAQLHQLRGRVGRGSHKSYCVLISGDQTSRLQALEETTDGFVLAQKDWEERGAGDLLGIRQSGGMSRSPLSPYMTLPLVEMAQHESRTLYVQDPQLRQPEHRILAQRVEVLRDARTDLS